MRASYIGKRHWQHKISRIKGRLGFDKRATAVVNAEWPDAKDGAQQST